MPRTNREATITNYFRQVGVETAQSILNVCREIVRERTTPAAPKPVKASKRGRPRKQQAQEPAAPAAE